MPSQVGNNQYQRENYGSMPNLPKRMKTQGTYNPQPYPTLADEITNFNQLMKEHYCLLNYQTQMDTMSGNMRTNGACMEWNAPSPVQLNMAVTSETMQIAENTRKRKRSPGVPSVKSSTQPNCHSPKMKKKYPSPTPYVPSPLLPNSHLPPAQPIRSLPPAQPIYLPHSNAMRGQWPTHGYPAAFTDGFYPPTHEPNLVYLPTPLQICISGETVYRGSVNHRSASLPFTHIPGTHQDVVDLVCQPDIRTEPTVQGNQPLELTTRSSRHTRKPLPNLVCYQAPPSTGRHTLRKCRVTPKKIRVAAKGKKRKGLSISRVGVNETEAEAEVYEMMTQSEPTPKVPNPMELHETLRKYQNLTITQVNKADAKGETCKIKTPPQNDISITITQISRNNADSADAKVVSTSETAVVTGPEVAKQQLTPLAGNEPEKEAVLEAMPPTCESSTSTLAVASDLLVTQRVSNKASVITHTAVSTSETAVVTAPEVAKQQLTPLVGKYAPDGEALSEAMPPTYESSTFTLAVANDLLVTERLSNQASVITHTDVADNSYSIPAVSTAGIAVATAPEVATRQPTPLTNLLNQPTEKAVMEEVPATGESSISTIDVPRESLDLMTLQTCNENANGDSNSSQSALDDVQAGPLVVYSEPSEVLEESIRRHKTSSGGIAVATELITIPDNDDSDENELVEVIYVVPFAKPLGASAASLPSQSLTLDDQLQSLLPVPPETGYTKNMSYADTAKKFSALIPGIQWYITESKNPDVNLEQFLPSLLKKFSSILGFFRLKLTMFVAVVGLEQIFCNIQDKIRQSESLQIQSVVATVAAFYLKLRVEYLHIMTQNYQEEQMEQLAKLNAQMVETVLNVLLKGEHNRIIEAIISRKVLKERETWWLPIVQNCISRTARPNTVLDYLRGIILFLVLKEARDSDPEVISQAISHLGDGSESVLELAEFRSTEVSKQFEKEKPTSVTGFLIQTQDFAPLSDAYFDHHEISNVARRH